MKRYEINEIISERDEFIRQLGYIMKKFEYWQKEEMKKRKDGDVEEIRKERIDGILKIKGRESLKIQECLF